MEIPPEVDLVPQHFICIYIIFVYDLYIIYIFVYDLYKYFTCDGKVADDEWTKLGLFSHTYKRDAKFLVTFNGTPTTLKTSVIIESNNKEY